MPRAKKKVSQKAKDKILNSGVQYEKSHKSVARPADGGLSKRVRGKAAPASQYGEQENKNLGSGEFRVYIRMRPLSVKETRKGYHKVCEVSERQ